MSNDTTHVFCSCPFHIPKSIIRRPVHTGAEKISALLHEVIRQPATAELTEVGQAFAQLASSPVFSKCVGLIDGYHVLIKTPPQEPVDRITSTKSSSHPYNCSQFVMARASSSTPLWDILAPSTILKNSRIYGEALSPHQVRIKYDLIIHQLSRLLHCG